MKTTMLKEHIVASIAAPHKAVNTAVTKDASIFQYELQPLPAQRASFKKSATRPHGLAVSRTHIFAAQADKAVIHVYDREKGNQEAVVPFKEKVTSLALACDDTVLVMGTEEGRLYLWEVRQTQGDVARWIR